MAAALRTAGLQQVIVLERLEAELSQVETPPPNSLGRRGQVRVLIFHAPTLLPEIETTVPTPLPLFLT